MRRSTCWFGPLAVIAVALMPARARAQEVVPASPPAASSAAPVLTQSSAVSYDSVHLRNGGLYRGRVTEIVPGDHVTLIVDGGETKQLPWADVERIVAGTAPAGAPSPPATPPVRTAPSTPVAPWPETTPPPATPVAPRTQWRANRPLLVTGAVLFAAGYGPNVAVALPSTVGFVGRVVVLLLTVGLPCLFNSSGDYLCSGQHGAMQLLVPFAGPFLFASDHPRDSVVNETGSPLSPTVKGLLYASAGLQLAGVASIFAALVTGRHEVVEAPAAARATLPTPSLTVAPLAVPGSVGLSLGVHRW